MKARRAIGYCRVSTDGQANRGVSLDAQAEKIRAMPTVQDAELIDVIVDGGESGKSLQRQVLSALSRCWSVGKCRSSSSPSSID